MAAPSPSSSYKGIQESMSLMYRSMSPVLQKLISMRNRRLLPAPDKHAWQQSQNLKWQQEMFHGILQLVGRLKEGLATEEQLDSFRRELLDSVTALHEDGEWPEFTRDKLLFLQDLLHTGCIGEADYHKAKRVIMNRLAEQDAEISSQDFDFSVPSPSRKQKRMPTTAVEIRIGEEGEQVGDFSPNKNTGPSPKKSPLKHITSRLKKGLSLKDGDGGSKQKIRVPHALDFLRPDDCPKRHPPVPSFQKPSDAPADSPLFHSPQVVPSMESSSQVAEPKDAPVTPSSRPEDGSPSATDLEAPLLSASQKQSTRSPGVGTLVSGFMRKLQGDSDKKPVEGGDENWEELKCEEEEPPARKRLWRLDLLRPPRKLLGSLGASEKDTPVETPEDDDEDERTPLNDKLQRETPKGQGPDTVKIKQKLHQKGAPTDFFIDKVLGDNIKTELARIRSELQQTNPGQTFTNDQIDAIATRLPVDKTELMRFFPKSWCDRYGEIVLEVVHKEFKDHVSEMENVRKAGGGKRTKPVKEGKPERDQSCSSPLTHTDKENRHGVLHRSPKITANKCFATTEGSPCVIKKTGLEDSSQKVTPRKGRSLNQEMDLEEEIDGKLIAEIQKLPLRRHNDSRPIRI